MRYVLLVLTALTLSLVAPDARAGVYEVRLCASSAADPAWKLVNTSTETLSVSALCPAAPGQTWQGLMAYDTLGAFDTPHNAAAAWVLSAPVSTHIRTLNVRRYLGHRHDWESAILTSSGGVLDQCAIVSGQQCERGVPSNPGQPAVTFAGLNTASVTFRVRCVAGPCSNGFSLRRAWIAVYGGSVTVEDPAGPTLDALTGTFGDAGWHKGTDTVTVSASDASGVKALRLVAGSQELGRKDVACDYTRMQPCPGSLGGTFAVDTAQLPDGTHELKAIATDAADQEGTAVGTIRVDRRAPGVPTGVAASAGDDGTYALKWTNPDQGTASPIVAARYEICDVTCQPPQRVAGAAIDQISKLSLPAGKSSVRVWLEDEAGNVDPANAAVTVVDTSVLRSTRVVDTKPPILLPSGPAPSPKLKVTKARRSGSTLTLSGTIAPGASARITASLARTRSGKAVVTRRATPRRGKWSIRLKLSASLRSTSAMYLTLSYAGQTDFRKTTLKRKLSRRAANSAGNTAVEFSIEPGRR